LGGLLGGVRQVDGEVLVESTREGSADNPCERSSRGHTSVGVVGRWAVTANELTPVNYGRRLPNHVLLWWIRPGWPIPRCAEQQLCQRQEIFCNRIICGTTCGVSYAVTRSIPIHTVEHSAGHGERVRRGVHEQSVNDQREARYYVRFVLRCPAQCPPEGREARKAAGEE
jgi:hypothetical protein